LHDSQDLVNELVYATHNKIWNAQETHKTDEINLQNNVMQVDQSILDVDCNAEVLDPAPLPNFHNSTLIQRMPPIKDSERGGSWGIRLLTATSFAKWKKVQTSKDTKAIHCDNRPAGRNAVKGKRVMQRMFWTARLLWATLILALIDAVGVLVPAPQPLKAMRPGRAVRNVVFFATMMMTMVLSYSNLIEQSTLMAISALGLLPHGSLGLIPL